MFFQNNCRHFLFQNAVWRFHSMIGVGNNNMMIREADDRYFRELGSPEFDHFKIGG